MREVIKQGLLSLEQSVRMFRKICAGIEYAHKHKVLHRDIKPANILIDANGEPRITDFGLAKRLDVGRSLSNPGDIVGTPKYMAPEHADGKEIDKRADIYSLGVLLYEMLTGRTPFEGDSIFNILSQLANAEPILPRALNPDIPSDLQTICMKCLQKYPKRRYFSARLLGRDIDMFLQNRPIYARPPGYGEKLLKWTQRNKLLTCFMLLLALFCCFASAALITIVRTQQKNQNLTLEKIYKLGCELFHRQQSASANNEFTKGVELPYSPAYPNLLYKLHWMNACALFTSDFAQKTPQLSARIAQNLRQALALHLSQQERCKLYLLLALVYADMNQRQQAKTAWEQAQKIFSGNHDLVRQFANALAPENRDQYRCVLTPKQFLELCGRENVREDLELWFTMPPPQAKLTPEDAGYYLLANLLPEEEAQKAREKARHKERAKAVSAKSAGVYLGQEIYKIAYALAEDIPLWARHMLGSKHGRSSRRPYPSELKELLYYIRERNGKSKWILDMASPYWTRLPVAWQQHYAGLYQSGYARQLGQPVIEYLVAQQAKFAMVLIPPGQFLMGRAWEKEPEGPQHQVIIGKPFRISQTEVTMGQWTSINRTRPWEKINERLQNLKKHNPAFPVMHVWRAPKKSDPQEDIPSFLANLAKYTHNRHQFFFPTKSNGNMSIAPAPLRYFSGEMTTKTVTMVIKVKAITTVPIVLKR